MYPCIEVWIAPCPCLQGEPTWGPAPSMKLLDLSEAPDMHFVPLEFHVFEE